jgi:4-hydroxy-2-oxoheptanedioate aldolase
MHPNHVRARLRAGEPSIGSWLSVPNPLSARLMGQTGFDWLTVDMEHQPIGIESAAQMFAVIAATGTAPLARVPWNTAENIKRVLDCGAWGIVVPMVNTRAEAEAAVAAAKYPPQGIRSVGGTLHALNFGTDAPTYFARANEEILVVLQAESPAAVENADAILSVPGVDAVFIGPNDLLSQMGMSPKMESDHSRFVEALDHLVKTARKHGVAPGIHTADHEAAVRRIGQGFQFVAIASEVRFMVAEARAQLAATGWQPTRRAAGETIRY